MTDSFEDLGINPELAAGARDLGWEAPTALQRDAVPVLRRGNNAVLHASTGAGVTGAWGLALLDRLASLDPDPDGAGPLALVLTPSSEEASRTAATLARAGAAAGVTVRALAPGWTDRPTAVLVASPTAAMGAVRDSTLKLDPVSILVIAGADRIVALGDWDSVRTLAESATSVGQKILVTGAREPAIEQFAERHVRKALTIPPTPDGDPEPAGGSLRYALATDDGKVDALVALLEDGGDNEVAVVCRTAARAAEIAAELAARGLAVEGTAAAASDHEGARRILVLPADEADRRSTRATVLSADVPADADTLAELHGSGGTVVATPAELPHVRRTALRAGLRLQPVALPRPAAGDPAEAVRDALRDAIAEVDLAAWLALVQPLLDEYPTEEVAAAALYLARTRGRSAGSGAGSGASEGAGGANRAGGPARGPAGAGAPPPSTAFVRLFISAGQRDDISAGDLVGAITGEAGVAGETVGRIDIRESHSTVEVASADADAVIRALNGRTLKGRSLRVDYDRKDRAAGPPSGGRSGSPPGRGGPRGGAGGGRRGGKPGGSRPGGSRPGGSRPGGSRPGGSRPPRRGGER